MSAASALTDDYHNIDVLCSTGPARDERPRRARDGVVIHDRRFRRVRGAGDPTYTTVIRVVRVENRLVSC